MPQKLPRGSKQKIDDQGWRQRAMIPTLVMVAALVAIMSSLGAPLIPSIARADKVSLSTAEWLLTATLMTGALATPIMGHLADGPLKRRVIEIALSVVFVGCVLSAVSTSFVEMVIGRGLQGVGLGLLPVTMAIARSQFSGERAGRTIATLSVTAAVGAGLGYPLTALIAQLFNIRAAFWFGAIIVALALALATTVLPSRSDAVSQKLDIVGMVTLGLAVIGVSFVLSEGGGWGWTSSPTIGMVAGCVFLIGLWIRQELTTPDPLIDVRQVRNRSVLTADVSGFLIAVAMYLFLPIIVEFVQIPVASGYGFGASVVLSGLVLVPLSIGSFAASRCLVFYQRRFGIRTMIPFGSLVFAVSALFFAVAHRSLWEAFVAAGMAGIGIGFTFAAMPGFIVRAVPVSETGSAIGFYQVLRSIGLSVGSALAAAILTASTSAGQVIPRFGGFHATLLVASSLGAVTALLSYVLPGRSVESSEGLGPVTQGIIRSDTSDDIRTAAQTHVARRLVAPVAADLTRQGLDRPDLRAAIVVCAVIGVNLGRALGWFDTLKTVPREELVELIAAMFDSQQSAEITET